MGDIAIGAGTGAVGTAGKGFAGLEGLPKEASGRPVGAATLRGGQGAETVGVGVSSQPSVVHGCCYRKDYWRVDCGLEEWELSCFGGCGCTAEVADAVRGKLWALKGVAGEELGWEARHPAVNPTRGSTFASTF